MSDSESVAIQPFNRFQFESGVLCTRIGSGGIGGKAAGLLRIQRQLAASLPAGRSAGINVAIPRFVVIATDVFDAFLARNHLHAVLAEQLPDDQLAHAFQKAELPSEILGDLRALVEEVHEPLAVRSSSLLEDALDIPFAGIYETKMIPNNAPEPDVRFHRLVEAIKFVFASTYFAAARSYRQACAVADGAEKMAVLLQEIVGERHGNRYYPHISSVCRSYSYYPTGRARPQDGFVGLALGLGKTIVDGGVCWSYAPRYPRRPPPFGSVRDMLHATQTSFWAVRMGGAPVYDPIAETEYLVRCDLADAEYDDVLRLLASTYDTAADRLRPGIAATGPRVLNFAPLLELGELPLNDALTELLHIAESAFDSAVEIELAVLIPASRQAEPRIGVLQARAMMAPHEVVDLTALARPGRALLRSARALGNGVIDHVCDVVYLRPDTFEARFTPRIAAELEAINRALVADGKSYLLIGFGRWGSSDPWLGVPVTWGQVSGARAIVETAMAGMNIEPSQGSHFFHNLSSLRVLYFTVPAEAADIDWSYLDAQQAAAETTLVRHVRLPAPLLMGVDGRTGAGMIYRPADAPLEAVPL